MNALGEAIATLRQLLDSMLFEQPSRTNSDDGSNKGNSKDDEPFYTALRKAIRNPAFAEETYEFVRVYLDTEIYKQDYSSFARQKRSLYYMNEILGVLTVWDSRIGDNESHTVVQEISQRVDKAIILLGTLEPFTHHLYAVASAAEDILFTPMPAEVETALMSAFTIETPPALNFPMQIDLAEPPSISEFLTLNSKPFIIRNIFSQWPLVSSHLPSILAKKAHRTIPLETGGAYTSTSFSQSYAEFSFLITAMHSSSDSAYLAQYEVLNLFPDWTRLFETPHYCYTSESNVSINAWIGPRGTKSPMHKDPRDNVFAQARGYKLWRLVDPRVDEGRLYLYGKDEMMGNTSKIDMSSIDYAEFPEFKGVEYTECVVGPGDMLFVPKGWYHYVESLTASISISFWF